MISITISFVAMRDPRVAEAVFRLCEALHSEATSSEVEEPQPEPQPEPPSLVEQIVPVSAYVPNSYEWVTSLSDDVVLSQFGDVRCSKDPDAMTVRELLPLARTYLKSGTAVCELHGGRYPDHQPIALLVRDGYSYHGRAHEVGLCHPGYLDTTTPPTIDKPGPARLILGAPVYFADLANKSFSGQLATLRSHETQFGLPPGSLGCSLQATSALMLAIRRDREHLYGYDFVGMKQTWVGTAAMVRTIQEGEVEALTFGWPNFDIDGPALCLIKSLAAYGEHASYIWMLPTIEIILE